MLTLLKKSFDALPQSGGYLLVHEMFLADDHDRNECGTQNGEQVSRFINDLCAACYGMHMIMFTNHGRQVSSATCYCLFLSKRDCDSFASIRITNLAFHLQVGPKELAVLAEDIGFKIMPCLAQSGPLSKANDRSEGANLLYHRIPGSHFGLMVLAKFGKK